MQGVRPPLGNCRELGALRASVEKGGPKGRVTLHRQWNGEVQHLGQPPHRLAFLGVQHLEEGRILLLAALLTHTRMGLPIRQPGDLGGSPAKHKHTGRLQQRRERDERTVLTTINYNYN